MKYSAHPTSLWTRRGDQADHTHIDFDASDKHDDSSHRYDVDDSSWSHRSRSDPSVCGDRSVHRDTT